MAAFTISHEASAGVEAPTQTETASEDRQRSNTGPVNSPAVWGTVFYFPVPFGADRANCAQGDKGLDIANRLYFARSEERRERRAVERRVSRILYL